jgi:hypothetical protein
MRTYMSLTRELAEENAKLREINAELVEICREILEMSAYPLSERIEIRERAEAIIAKAEKEIQK